MLDILDFIDSPDIRKHNRMTKFTPAEKSVLITMSKNTTVQNKLAALQELVDTYKESEFTTERMGTRFALQDTGIKSFRSAVKSTIYAWTNALEKRGDKNCIFELVFSNSTKEENDYFSNYNDAYEMLKKYNLECDFDEEKRYIAWINKLVNMGGEYKEKSSFIFNQKSEMTSLTTLEVEYADISECFVYVPIPFKRGDIVKTDNRYGVFNHMLLKSETILRMCKSFDSSDMLASVDFFITDDKNALKGEFDFDEVDVLSLKLVKEEKLPPHHKYLKLLSHTMKNDKKGLDMLWYYSSGQLDNYLDFIEK